MVESLPIMVDEYVKEQVKKQVPEQVRDQALVYVAKELILERHQNKEEMAKMIAEAIQQERGNLQAEIYSQIQNVPATTCRTPAVRPRDQDDPHDDSHPEGENSEKWQKTSEYEAYVSGESSSRQVNESDHGLSSSGNQEQVNDYDFWTDSYASDDDEIPTKQKGSSRLEKIMLSLHKFPAVIFNDDDIEERTSRWVNKCVKKFNPYARYGVEHWKNSHAKIFYIRKQKEPGKPKEVIVARRANECIVSITEPDFKNINKNDIKDMYLLIMNGKLGVESYQQKVNLTAPTISFPGIEKHEMFSIIYEPVHGIIYKNSKQEKRVMRHSEVHKFCDATLNRVLKGLKSYNNDVKYGYIHRNLTKEEVEYLQLFEEEIEERLKHRNQLRR
ncbi:hypothetical protein Tco_0876978 [Tanacetum coccineum]|uniref:Uncharacterized protein n=1 Tax=Tanacetum coccineum TaxID=301880 RepID=A0ABQ5BWQ9_9ASTR